MNERRAGGLERRMQMNAMTMKRRAMGTAAAIGAGLALMAAGAQPALAAPGPKLVQVTYEESNDAGEAPMDLAAHFKDADAVRFTTRYDGERASGEARYIENISDTDLNGEAQHPWSLVRKGDGKRVAKLVHESLFERGVAKVRIRARGDGEHYDGAVEISLAGDCSQDPPLYPLTCQVKS
jgi:hypothetical protein